MFCHAGLSSIFLEKSRKHSGQTSPVRKNISNGASWNNNQCGLIYDRISNFVAIRVKWLVKQYAGGCYVCFRKYNNERI